MSLINNGYVSESWKYILGYNQYKLDTVLCSSSNFVLLFSISNFLSTLPPYPFLPLLLP